MDFALCGCGVEFVLFWGGEGIQHTAAGVSGGERREMKRGGNEWEGVERDGEE